MRLTMLFSDLYYSNKALYRTQQRADRTVSQLCQLLQEPRSALHLVRACF